ncbi:peptidase inhibitor family I36 protein [Streptomyces lycii]|uniref:Peptidase inhibitor family I36 n=1 Tax=Streptomyces lycii TaxID=2654337 RepID=A0ABQ7FMF2_9ACTN|nr:peptidase inhibitor family I36 protein [Streptomyces lycii]KAF4410126.1 hypothetical protein GCU69_05470 [Streptomyces lycii]
MSVRSRLAGSVLAAVTLLTTGSAVSTAHAAEPAAGTAAAGAVATYHGERIDLARGWGGAHTCAVFSRSDIRCYDTAAAADRATGYERRSDPLYRGGEHSAAALPACANGWVCLWEHTNGNGRRLIFNDDYWHDLNQFNFNDKTSSWRNNQSRSDAGHLARDEGGRGGHITLSGGGSYSANLGAYNDWASSVAG